MNNPSSQPSKPSTWPLIFAILICAAGLAFGLTNGNMELTIVNAVLIFIFIIMLVIIRSVQSKYKTVMSHASKVVENPLLKLTNPVFVDPYSGFIFKGMLESMKYHFTDDFEEGDAMINVVLDGVTIMQIIDCPDREKGEKHDVMLYFYPMFDDNVAERFKNCFYKDDFDMQEENNLFQAFYGDDFEQAAKVASYVLATVYYIPTDMKLKYDLCSC